MKEVSYSRSMAKLESKRSLMKKRACRLINAFFEMERIHGKQEKALVFGEDMRKIAPDKIGRALILLAIEGMTAKRS